MSNKEPNKGPNKGVPPIRLLIVAPDNRLVRAVRAADQSFEPVRMRDFEKALKKRETRSADFLLVQWTTTEVFERLSASPPCRTVPYFVFCPDLPQKSVAEGEEIRFALLQYGTTAVFSQLRKLPQFLELVKRYARRFPAPEKHWSDAIAESLPWKTA